LCFVTVHEYIIPHVLVSKSSPHVVFKSAVFSIYKQSFLSEKHSPTVLKSTRSLYPVKQERNCMYRVEDPQCSNSNICCFYFKVSVERWTHTEPFI